MSIKFDLQIHSAWSKYQNLQHANVNKGANMGRIA